MSLLKDISGKIDNTVKEVEGWIDDVKPHVATLLDTAAKYENSPIVQALESVVLPPAVEAELAKLITAAAAEFGKLTGTDTPAAPAAESDTPIGDAAQVTAATPDDTAAQPAPAGS